MFFLCACRYNHWALADECADSSLPVLVSLRELYGARLLVLCYPGTAKRVTRSSGPARVAITSCKRVIRQKAQACGAQLKWCVEETKIKSLGFISSVDMLFPCNLWVPENVLKLRTFLEDDKPFACHQDQIFGRINHMGWVELTTGEIFQDGPPVKAVFSKTLDDPFGIFECIMNQYKIV